MKKVLQLLLIMILIFCSKQADAAVLSSSEVKNIIAKQVLEIYKGYTDAELSVEVIVLPFSSLTIPDGKISFTVTSSNNKFMARDLEKVSVFVDNKLVKTFNAPVVVKAYQDVLVASKFINIGQKVDTNSTTIKRLEISNTIGYQLRPEALKNEVMAKKAFREGEVIDKRFTKFRPEIIRNANVVVFFNTNNLTVSTEAIALSDGTIGDSICLVNKGFKKVYKGKVIGENKVLVKI